MLRCPSLGPLYGRRRVERPWSRLRNGQSNASLKRRSDARYPGLVLQHARRWRPRSRQKLGDDCRCARRVDRIARVRYRRSHRHHHFGRWCARHRHGGVRGSHHLYQFAVRACGARSSSDLDAAGAHFATAVGILGIQAVLAVLFRGAPKTYRGGLPRRTGPVTARWMAYRPTIRWTKYEPKVGRLPAGKAGRTAGAI